MKGKDVAGIGICAALYMATILTTAYIPTGVVIQFRPALIVPAIFAVVMGPWVGGLGAALGTFIASIIRYGTPILTIFSGTPGNFLGFFILGYAFRALVKRYHWTISYTIACILGTLVGSSVVVIGLYFLATVINIPTLVQYKALEFLPIGLAFQLAYGIPLAILLGLPIIKAIYAAFPSMKPSKG